MPKTLYCWRCRMDVPMLNEEEWAIVLPLLRDPHDNKAALDAYNEITSFYETNINAVWHHRASDYGPPCKTCHKPLRTPRARFCAACGAEH